MLNGNALWELGDWLGIQVCRREVVKEIIRDFEARKENRKHE